MRFDLAMELGVERRGPATGKAHTGERPGRRCESKKPRKVRRDSGEIGRAVTMHLGEKRFSAEVVQHNDRRAACPRNDELVVDPVGVMHGHIVKHAIRGGNIRALHDATGIGEQVAVRQ